MRAGGASLSELRHRRGVGGEAGDDSAEQQPMGGKRKLTARPPPEQLDTVSPSPAPPAPPEGDDDEEDADKGNGGAGGRAWPFNRWFTAKLVGSGVASALVFKNYLRPLWAVQAEVRRLSAVNGMLAGRLRNLSQEVPDELTVGSNEGDGFETFVFLLGCSFLGYIAFNFLKKEYDMLSKTKTSIKDMSFAGHSDDELLRQFIFYRLDYWFSSSVYGKPVVLLTLTLILILVGGMLNWMVNTDTLGYALWRSWAFIADSGAHADEVETGARIVALTLTIGGMLVFALVIGLISEGISTKFDQLKAGRAKVVETDHSLILGWSDKTIPLIREIANANESAITEGTSNGVIVVLADKEKDDMEQEIRIAQVGNSLNLRGSMVVCRKGNPTVLHHLQHVSAETARSIVVLSPLGVSADEADARCLRTVLCLVGLKYEQGHITVEVQDVDNRDLVHIIGGKNVETVVAHDFIGRLIVQSSRQSGLAKILEHILGFEGHEFYMSTHDDALVGRTFQDVMFMFEAAIVIGVRTAQADSDAVRRGDRLDEHTLLNPPDDYIIEQGDAIIVIAEDDDTYEPAEGPLTMYPPPDGIDQRQRRKVAPKAEKVLLVGWRRDLGDMLKELDQVVGRGSELCLFSTIPLDQREEKLSANGRDAHRKLQNLTLRHAEGNPIVRRELERLPIEEFESVFILADEEFEADMEAADGRSLTSLLLIHDIRRHRLPGGGGVSSPRDFSFDTKGSSMPSAIVSEVLDPRTRQVIQLAHVSDYVMSNEMVSAALAMVSECRDVNAILKEILSSQGNEIYVRDVDEYVDDGTEMSFWQLASLLRTHGCLLLGYWERGAKEAIINPDGEPRKPYYPNGVPAKADQRVWRSGEKVVVLSED